MKTVADMTGSTDWAEDVIAPPISTELGRPPFKIIEGVDTEPFVRLSPWAVWVLARFYCKWDGRIRNRTNLSLTYKEVRSAMSPAIFTRSIWECIAFGFLDSPLRAARAKCEPV